VQHSMKDTSHFRDENSNGRRARETPPNSVVTIRILKSDNERLMRAQAKHEELNEYYCRVYQKYKNTYNKVLP
jgi:hypothetical protein